MLRGAYGGQVEWITRSARRRVCALEVHLLIGRSETQGYFATVPSVRLAGRGPIAGAGNIGQGIMIFAEGDTKSKMYADISDGYSYRILGTAAWNKTLFRAKSNEETAQEVFEIPHSDSRLRQTRILLVIGDDYLVNKQWTQKTFYSINIKIINKTCPHSVAYNYYKFQHTRLQTKYSSAN